jgi:hypothetical protein
MRVVNRERVVSLRVARCAAMWIKKMGEPAKSASTLIDDAIVGKRRAAAKQLKSDTSAYTQRVRARGN